MSKPIRTDVSVFTKVSARVLNRQQFLQLFPKLQSRLNAKKMERPKLVSAEGTEIVITTDKFTIGRSVSNSYILEIISISRVHCIIEKLNNRWTVTDKSSNGMSVNTKKLQKDVPEILKDCDMIFLSNEVAFTFKIPTPVFSNMGIEDDFIARVVDDLEQANPTVLNPTDVNRRRTRQYSAEIINLENSLLIELGNPSTSEEPAKEVPNPNVHSSLTDPINLLTNTKQEDISLPSQNSKLDYFISELTCSICMELFINASTLNCRHTYCSHCIESWRKYHKVCPMCRTKISKEVSSIVIDNVVNKIVEGMSKSDVKRREQIIAERAMQPKKSKGPSKRRTRRVVRQDEDSFIEISSEEDEIVL